VDPEAVLNDEAFDCSRLFVEIIRPKRSYVLFFKISRAV